MPAKVTYKLQGDMFVDLPKQSGSSKPKPYIEAEWIAEYRLNRDRVIFKTCCQESKDEILAKYKK